MPIWRDAFTTPEAAPDTSGGDIAHGDVGDAGDQQAEAGPAQQEADGGHGERRRAATRLSAKTPAAPATHPAATTAATG